MTHQLSTPTSTPFPKLSRTDDASSCTLDYSLPFEHFFKSVRNVKTNRKIIKYSHRYWVLLALYHGNIIDDYENKPQNLNNQKYINNVVQRVNELINLYDVNIKSRRVNGMKYHEYYLERG